MANRHKSEEISIVKAKQEDAESISAFYDALIQAMTALPHRPKWTMGVYPSYEDIRKLCIQEAFYLAVENDMIRGAVAIVSGGEQSHAHVPWKCKALPQDIATIHLLAVSPAVQNKGIGLMLMKYAEKLCRQRGNQVIRLDTLPESMPANRLYQKCGFTLVATDTRVYESVGSIRFHYYELSL